MHVKNCVAADLTKIRSQGKHFIWSNLETCSAISRAGVYGEFKLNLTPIFAKAFHNYKILLP